jgi:hypothetical protein
VPQVTGSGAASHTAPVATNQPSLINTPNQQQQTLQKQKRSPEELRFRTKQQLSANLKRQLNSN